MNRIFEHLTINKTVAQTSGVNIRRIVVPVDLSAHSEKTASYAVALAKVFGASITFVHVFPPGLFLEIITQDIHEIYERDRDSKKEELASFTHKICLAYPQCYAQFRIGDIAEETKLAAGELDADLIIAASYHPNFLGRLFGFEKAAGIVHRAPCPVLVFHEPNE